MRGVIFCFLLAGCAAFHHGAAPLASRRARPLLHSLTAQPQPAQPRLPQLALTMSANAAEPRRQRPRTRISQLKRLMATSPKRLVILLPRLKPFLPAIAALLWFAFTRFTRGAARVRPVEVSYGAFMSLVGAKAKRISGLSVSPVRFSYLLDGRPAYTRPVRASAELLGFLHRAGLDFRASPTSPLTVLGPLLFPALWLGAVYSLMRRQMGAGASGNVGKRASTALRLSSDEFSFDDVAGIDAAKGEVQEIVTMISDPARFARAGARLPKGILMNGPPGTGKTLLARVVAAQAGVPFFYCSGSDFVELFVGRGAARMRNLFKEASEVGGPCLIFIDELDALGKQRSLRIGSSNDEVEQTLNQMLACMDGVGTAGSQVIVLGATNRYEILDPALTRPGRFDRVVRIPLPDEAGRAAILRIHTRKLALGPDVDLVAVAKATPSFSGAELAALANEAAIRAARRGDSVCRAQDFAQAALAFASSRQGGTGSAALAAAVTSASSFVDKVKADLKERLK